MGELAKDFVQRVANSLSGNLSPPGDETPPADERRGCECFEISNFSEALYLDYEEMEFGDVLDFGFQAPKVVNTLKTTKQKVVHFELSVQILISEGGRDQREARFESEGEEEG